MVLTSSQPRQIGWFGYLTISAIGLSLVLTWLGPRSSEGLGTLNSLFFWFAHVSIGLALLAGAQLMLGRLKRFTTLPPLLQVGLGGLAGALAFTPAAFGLDVLFQPPGAIDDTSQNLLQEILIEIGQFLVPISGLWVLLNAPTLVQIRQNQGREEATVEAKSDPADEFWQRVPKSLGRNLIALSAELHYLRVYTSAGDTLILFAFGRAVEILDSTQTCQIHRSHWVSLKHVEDLVTGNGAMTCVLSNGLSLPVSRRHRKALRLGTQSVG